MMHHQTKFGYKRLNSSVDIISEVLNLQYDLDLKHSNAIFSQGLYDVPSKFGRKMVRSSEDMTETITF